jgi:hypothetical protein
VQHGAHHAEVAAGRLDGVADMPVVGVIVNDAVLGMVSGAAF